MEKEDQISCRTESKREPKATLDQLFKKGKDFNFSNTNYGGRRGARILKKLEKDRAKIYAQADFDINIARKIFFPFDPQSP